MIHTYSNTTERNLLFRHLFFKPDTFQHRQLHPGSSPFSNLHIHISGTNIGPKLRGNLLNLIEYGEILKSPEYGANLKISALSGAYKILSDMTARGEGKSKLPESSINPRIALANHILDTLYYYAASADSNDSVFATRSLIDCFEASKAVATRQNRSVLFAEKATNAAVSACKADIGEEQNEMLLGALGNDSRNIGLLIHIYMTAMEVDPGIGLAVHRSLGRAAAAQLASLSANLIDISKSEPQAYQHDDTRIELVKIKLSEERSIKRRNLSSALPDQIGRVSSAVFDFVSQVSGYGAKAGNPIQ